MLRPIDFTVVGTGAFPVDMLRYDCCYPVDTDSALAIVVGFRDSDYNEVRRVSLRMRVTTPREGPTAERWLSFGWSIVPGSLRRG